jgi:hypothetical protein
MRRALVASFIAFAVPVALAGCGGNSTPIPVTVKAPPQTARLGWEEKYPADEAALVFGVSSFTVTRNGWKADVSVENRSKVGWEVGDPRRAAERAFGVLLFPNNDLGELDRRNRNGDLPAIRPATSFSPSLPTVLRPGKTWKGTIAAPGALAGGLWVRLSFGTFSSVGDPPKGAAPQVVWFTDHAHELDQVAADPA